MKRSGPLQRKTPLKAKAPMARGTSTLKQKTPMSRSQILLTRSSKPMKARSKTNSDPRPKTGEAELCRGQPCYLQVPGVPAHPLDTVVPCHSNQAKHGKGRSIKAHDKYTVPGCMHCHREIDQGSLFTRDEKFALWDDAYERWEPVRNKITNNKDI